jgi:hypothetical protein
MWRNLSETCRRIICKRSASTITEPGVNLCTGVGDSGKCGKIDREGNFKVCYVKKKS